MTYKRRILCPLSVVIIIVAFLQASGTTYLPSSEIASSSNLILIVQTESPFYGSGEVVKIRGNLTDTNGTAIQGAKIAIEVRNPRNNTIFIDIVFTSIDGTFKDSFRLDKNAMLGDYYVYGTANAIGYPATTNQTTFMVVTVAHLSEKTFTASDLNETVLLQNATINNAEVQGDLSGALSFTSFEMVSITTGPFDGKGFSKGTWEATLEGISYKGEWRGAFYFIPSDRKIYLKGAVSGEMTGVVEGYIRESVAQSGVYDRYLATWKIGRLGTTIISATLSLNGTLAYHSYSEFPSTGLYILQTSVEGSATGHYNCSLSSTLTQIRVSANSPFVGEGFSIISYSSNYGMGEGWTYDRLASPGIVEMKGFLTSPLYGIVYATLNETTLPRSLHMYIERVDLGLPPMADLKVRIWGFERVSPGQTVTYSVELRNDGLKGAENVALVTNLPYTMKYLSSTGDGAYNVRSHEVIWRLKDVRAKACLLFTVTGSIEWGLTDGTVVEPIASMPVKEVEAPIDPTVNITYTVLEATEKHVKTIINVSNQSASGVLHVEVFLATVPDKIEPYFEFTEDDEVTVKFEYTVEGASWKKIWGIIKGLNIARKIVETAKDFHDISVDAKKQEDQFKWALDTGKIPPEDYKRLSDGYKGKSTFEAIVPNVIREVPVLGPAYHDLTEAIMKGLKPIYKRQLLISMMVHDPEHAPTTIEEMDKLYLEERSHDVSSTKSVVAVARDPNIKYGLEGYVLPGQTLNYTVEYENEGEGIAFGVYFTDILDEDLDDSTLEIGQVISKTNGSVITGPGTYNPATRTITWLVGEVGPGEGGLATFNVKVKNDAPEGTEIINFATVYFPSVPETTRTNTIISVVGHPSIAIRDLTPLETVIARGAILYLNLTVVNEGHLAETFNLTIYANSTIIRTQNITMPGRSEDTILLVWNTTDFAIGNYNISAYAWPVPGETNTTDNLYVDGIVQIVLPIHDIAITNITFSKQYPAINETIYIYVTVKNEGESLETFQVSVNYTLLLDPLIGTQTITLAPGETITLNFTWTPNATGRYEIKAYTSAIPNDIDPSDNTKITYLYVSATYASTFSEEENPWADVLRGGRFYYQAYPI